METPAWVTDSVFYQIFPDRFAQSTRLSKQGLRLEEWEAPPTTYGFKGGDLLGVAEHLDYLLDLGVNALYLNPVFASASNHRYHTYDYYNVDPLLGGNAALRELLDAAHARGIRVILDGVFNHASRGFWQFHHTLESGEASPYVDWFHFDAERLTRRRHWGAYPSPEEQQAILKEGSLRAVGYQGWWELPALPKFNTNSPAVREFLYGVAQHWTRFGIDGWRLDVPNEINDDEFWREFRRRVRSINSDIYVVGEIWNDARRWLQGDQFDATTNYPLTAACLGFLCGDHLDLQQTLRAGGYHGQVWRMDARAFAERIDSHLRLYRPEVTRVQLNLLDSHDTARFITCSSGDLGSLKLALTFLMTFPGAPCIFYGDEIGLAGGHDPQCRQAFPWARHHWNLDLLEFTRNLIRLRRSSAELRWGDFRCLAAEASAYAFERCLEGRRTVVALNAGEEPQELLLDLGVRQEQPLRVILGAPEIEPGAQSVVRIPARTAVIFRREAT